MTGVRPLVEHAADTLGRGVILFGGFIAVVMVLALIGEVLVRRRRARDAAVRFDRDVPKLFRPDQPWTRLP